MFAAAISMLLHNPLRLFVTLAGLSCLFILSACQVGMLVGWCNTVSALVRHAGVDIWVVSPKTVAFDYGVPLPDIRIHQVRSVVGVEWAEGIYMDWSMWQRPDGKRISVEVVGLDDSSVGGPWQMRDGSVDNVHLPDAVIVDQAYLGPLGVSQVGEEFELSGYRVIVRGISEDVRTFTASPFVFTSLQQARRIDARYRDDEVTYVLARYKSGFDPIVVKQSLADEIPNAEVLTTDEFAQRTILYWMIETGVGLTAVITAILGMAVAAVVVSQTLYTLTQEHARDYATMLAIGFARLKLIGVVLIQSLVLATLSWILGTVAFAYVAGLTKGSAIPLEMTLGVYALLTAIHIGCCILASMLSVRSILTLDPAVVFRG